MSSFTREMGWTTKLKEGDVVRSLKTGKFYTVTKVIDEHWFLHNEATKNKFVMHYEVVSSTWNDCPKGGQHEWTDVGFRFTKIVCKHCDKEQETYGN